MVLPSPRLVPGDLIMIKPGTLPCDVVLVRGECIVDENMLTGERLSAKDRGSSRTNSTRASCLQICVNLSGPIPAAALIRRIGPRPQSSLQLVGGRPHVPPGQQHGVHAVRRHDGGAGEGRDERPAGPGHRVQDPVLLGKGAASQVEDRTVRYSSRSSAAAYSPALPGRDACFWSVFIRLTVTPP